MVVDERFFISFEKDRQKAQLDLRPKLGNDFNLTQRNFTSMLAKKGVRFKLPPQRSLGIRVRRKRR